jgi:hypothetical protein
MTLVWKSGLNLQSPASNDPLLDLNTQPSLDLQFATGKTLDDRVSGNNLVTFSRASTGTYVGSDGLIKTSPVNLFTYSKDFSLGWGPNQVTLSTNQGIAPDGTNTAALVTINTALSYNAISQTPTLSANTDYCYSVFVKLVSGSGTSTRFVFAASNNLIDPGYASYGLQLDNLSETGDGTTPSVKGYVEYPDGWYRIYMSVNTSSQTNPAVALRFGTGGADDIAEFLIWGAQLEEGTTATDYIPTGATISGAPRFDHDPVTGESLGLLIEESRTNLLTYSEQFDQSAWSKTENSGTPPQVTPNLAASPDGSITADRILCSKSGNTYSFVQQSSAYSGNETGSIYLKSNTNSNQTVYFRVGITASYVTVSTEWQRFSINSTYSGGGNFTIGARDSSDDVVDILAWGAQVEAGSFPTSYIPTTSSTVTRAADVASIEGTNFSSWFTQNTGTVFVEASLQSPAASGQSPIVSIDNSGADFRAIARRASAGVRNTSNADLIDVTGAIWDGEKKKIAATWVPNDCALVDDGVLVGTDTSTNSPLTTVNQMQIGHVNSGGFLARMGGHISRLAYYPYRLSDTILQEITS